MVKKLKKDKFFLDMNITLYEVGGKPTIQLRKLITLCEKNKSFWQKLILASFEDKPVVAPVKIVFKDKVRAFEHLKKLGLVKGEYKLKLV